MQYIRIPICLQESLGLTESQESRTRESRVKNREQGTSQEPRTREPRVKSQERRPRDESRTENKGTQSQRRTKEL